MLLQQKLPREVVPELPGRGKITLALGYNQKVMSRYSINRQDGRIHINKWGKSWPSVHPRKSEKMLWSCSTKAVMGFSCSLRPCHEQVHTSCSGMAWIDAGVI